MTVTAPGPGVESLFQLMPALSQYDYDNLKQSLVTWFRKFGTPFWPGGEPMVDNGLILDGHHRMQACAELDIPCPTQAPPVDWDDDAKWLYAFHSNMSRRHLTIEQRRAVALLMIKRFPAATLAEIAEAAGLSLDAVRRLRDAAAREGTIPQPVQYKRTEPGDDAFLRVVKSQQTAQSPEGEDDERTPENHREARGECFVEIKYGYVGQAPDGRIHVRPHPSGMTVPFPREQARLIHPTGRMMLTEPTPHSPEQAEASINEIARMLYRAWRGKAGCGGPDGGPIKLSTLG